MATTRRLALLALLSLLACESEQRLTAPDLEPAFEIGSALPAGSDGAFFFLPPIAPDPGARPAGSFDASLEPDVVVCVWTGSSCGDVVAEMSFGQGSGSVRVDEDAEQYVTNWHSSRALDPDAAYRILVRVAGAVLGVADVDVVASAKDLKGVDVAAVGLVRGRTLPIKFRIEKGAVTVVGPGGGKVEVPGATLVVTDGALKAPTGITVAPLEEYPELDDGEIIQGTVFDFGPDGLVFDGTAVLTLEYDPADLPPGVDQSRLRILRLTDGKWSPVRSAGGDHANGTLSGLVDHFSGFGIGFTSIQTLSGTGTAVVDGVLDPAEWLSAASIQFEITTREGSQDPSQVVATVYVMNDATDLFVGLAYPQGPTTAQQNLNLDFLDPELGYSVQGDETLLYIPTVDWYMDRHCVAKPLWVNCGEEDVAFGGTEDGTASFTNDGTQSIIEISHPLDDMDDLHDLNAVSGDVLSLFLGYTFFDPSGGIYSSTLDILIEVTGAPTWSATGDMLEATLTHTATLLNDGRVLVAGYDSDRAELYDPASGTFSDAGPTVYSHDRGTATLLGNGTVLLVGGPFEQPSAEIFDPVAGTFTASGSNQERLMHTATLLPDGKVLIAGGHRVVAGHAQSRADAEIYDPVTGTFTPTGPMLEERAAHIATLLPDGKVLIAGGVQTTTPGFGICLTTAELYDPATGVFSSTGGPTYAPCAGYSFGAPLLSTGKVMVLGNGAMNHLYDPATGTFSLGTPALEQHLSGRLTTLLDGRVLLSGGAAPGAITTASAEIYDPVTDSWTPTLSLVVSRQQHTATRLADGRVLVTGGQSQGIGALASAEIHPGN